MPTVAAITQPELNVMIKSVLVAFILAAATGGSLVLATESPLEFSPQNGFGGVSEGNGSLKFLFGKPRPFHVESHGNAQSDGTFRLEQTITFEKKTPQNRVWIISTVSPDRYSATLSDASGVVSGSTSGSRMYLQYRVKGPFVMHQKLQLKPDGKTIDNVGVITFLGIPIGHLQETIIHEGRSVKPDD